MTEILTIETDRSSETSSLLQKGEIYYLGSAAVTDPKKASDLFRTDWSGEFGEEMVEGKDFKIGEIVRLRTVYEKDGRKEFVAHRVVVYDASSLVETELRSTFNIEGLEEGMQEVRGLIEGGDIREDKVGKATKSLLKTLGQVRVAMYEPRLDEGPEEAEDSKEVGGAEDISVIEQANQALREVEDAIQGVRLRFEEKLKELEETKKKPPIVVIPNFNEGPALGPDFGLLATGRRVITLSYPREKHADFSNSSVLEWTKVEDYMPFFKAVFRQVRDLGYLEAEYYGLGSSGGPSMHLGLVNDREFRQEFEARGLVLHNPGGVMERSKKRVFANFFRQGLQGYVRERDLKTKVRMDDPLYPALAEDERVDPLLYLRDWKFLLNSAEMVGVKIPIPEDVPVLVLASEKDSIFPPDMLRESLSGEGRLKTSENPTGNVEVREVLRRSHIGLTADELVAQPALKWLREVENQKKPNQN